MLVKLLFDDGFRWVYLFFCHCMKNSTIAIAKAKLKLMYPKIDAPFYPGFNSTLLGIAFSEELLLELFELFELVELVLVLVLMEQVS